MSTSTLQNFRVGSDLTVKVRLKDGGVAIDWSTLSGIRAVLYSDAQSSIAGRCDVTVDGEDPTLLVCRYAATKMQYLGVNRIVVSAKYMGVTKTYDKPAFTFVRWSEDQAGEEISIEDPEVTVEIDVEDVSSSILQEAVDAAFTAADRANEAAEAAEHMVDIHTGPEGKSAYEVAVEEGYTGTEEQWLASLKGDTGETPDITIGTVTTVEPGEPAAASMSGTPEAPVLNLSIPKGLVGATPNFTVGTVTTGEPGTPVVVTITGTAEAPVLNITIPQGMQGNTGSSVDYPYELVNNLTTDDATKALSAAQGKALKDELSQLDLKVDELIEDLSDTTTVYSDVTPDGSIDSAYIASNGRIYSGGTGYIVYKKHFTEAAEIQYSIIGNDMGIVVSDTEPQKNETYTIVASGAGASGTYNVASGKWIAWGYKSATNKCVLQTETVIVGDLKDFSTKDEAREIAQEEIATDDSRLMPIAFVKSNDYERDLVQRGNIFAPMIVDWMQFSHAQSKMTSIAQMTVVSATADTLTLSSADFATFTDTTPVVVGFSDGTYKGLFVTPSTSPTVVRASWETVDLTNAQTIQSLHNTVMGGAGIHLSQMGYLGIAQYTAQEIAKQITQRDKNLITGMNFNTDTETDGVLYAPNGDTLATVDTDMVSGTGVDGSLSFHEIRTTSEFSCYGYGWLHTGYGFLQGGTAGKHLTFIIPAHGRGFVEVQGSLLNKTGNRIGGVNVEVFVDGVSVGASQSFAFSQKRLIFEGIRVNAEIKVKFSTASTSPTYAVINTINFYRMPSDVPVVSLSGKRVAVLGDSWTQFPQVGNGLADHSSFNVVVTRPDGTTGDGYGYFPKEFARVTGATVDNWGKSNMRADNWGLPEIDKILAFADYDYMLIEFFTNDWNASITPEVWAANIAKLCRKCEAKGVRPIIMGPCRNNGNSYFNTYWSKMHRGIGVI